MELTFEVKDLIDRTCHSNENLNCFSDHHYLKRFIPLSRQSHYPVPLGFRRSVSLEDTSPNSIDKCQKETDSDLLLKDCSLKSLCFHLKPYQLLSEYNQLIEKSANEHQFDWWNTIDHLRPLIEKRILYEDLKNEFEDDQNKEDQYLIDFQKSKRNRRRNAICFAIDRLFYNQQMILFVAITNEVQVQFNLISSGF